MKTKVELALILVALTACQPQDINPAAVPGTTTGDGTTYQTASPIKEPCFPQWTAPALLDAAMGPRWSSPGDNWGRQWTCLWFDPALEKLGVVTGPIQYAYGADPYEPWGIRCTISGVDPLSDWNWYGGAKDWLWNYYLTAHLGNEPQTLTGQEVYAVWNAHEVPAPHAFDLFPDAQNPNYLVVIFADKDDVPTHYCPRGQ